MRAPTVSIGTIDDPRSWRALFGELSRCRAEQLAGGNSPSRIWRVHLSGGHAPPTVIVKESGPPWSPLDPAGFRREALAYRLLDGNDDVAPRLLGLHEGDEGVRLVLEDLATGFAFRRRDHRWRPAEMVPVADVFARLHGHSADHPLLDDPVLMPAPDARWPSARIEAAAARLDATVVSGFGDGVRAAFRRWPASAPPVMPRCLAHSDFNPGNIAFGAAGATARLLDWHIAAAATPGFDVANLFFQPWSNHADLSVCDVLDAVDQARQRRGLDPWYDGERDSAFRYCTVWCALSYLPPIADRIDAGPVVGPSAWWLHTARAAHRALATEGMPA